MNIFRVAITLLFVVVLPLNSFSHSGRTDSQGGHNNRKTGGYHYHNKKATPTYNRSNSSEKSTDTCSSRCSKSGACSYHGGVDCTAGPDTDGSVICNDGWRNSSVTYLCK